MRLGDDRSWERGQALTETLIFVPLFLVLLYATLYVGQVGVKQERVQTAIRYGVNTLPNSEFSIEQMYQSFLMFNTSTPNNVPVPPVTPAPCATSVQTATYSAFNQAQTLPTSAPSAQPYWQIAQPSDTCVTTFLPVANLPDMYNTGMSYLEETGNTLSGTVNAPQFQPLQNLLPSSYALNGEYTGYLPATLNDMISCTPIGGGGHGSSNGVGLATALAQALYPGTSTSGVEPYYSGYNSENFSLTVQGNTYNANAVCNTG